MLFALSIDYLCKPRKIYSFELYEIAGIQPLFERNKNDHFIWFRKRELGGFYSPFPSIYIKGHFHLMAIHELCSLGGKLNILTSCFHYARK